MVLAAACGTRSDPSAPGASPDDADRMALRYGYGPVRDPAITYQPDVAWLAGGRELDVTPEPKQLPE